ncbi:MAG: hypothetical protein U1F76_12790 [Candidatus Competibacteraceae bacterium]
MSELEHCRVLRGRLSGTSCGRPTVLQPSLLPQKKKTGWHFDNANRQIGGVRNQCSTKKGRFTYYTAQRIGNEPNQGEKIPALSLEPRFEKKIRLDRLVSIPTGN